MKILLKTRLLAVLTGALVASPSSEKLFAEARSKGKGSNVQKKDVCVLGGGAAGSYTAYALQKRGYETVLIEPMDDLGGNCEIIEIPSTITPGTTYSVNAAVILFSPVAVVLDFFSEFGANTVPLLFGGGPGASSFIYEPGAFVAPAPATDPTPLIQAVFAYEMILISRGVNPATPLPQPDWDTLDATQRDFLLQPLGVYIQTAEGQTIAPLVPIISQLMQGFGPVLTLPVWEVLSAASPTYLKQIFGIEGEFFVQLVDGCQGIYNELENRMRIADAESVITSTSVNRIVREKNSVTVHAEQLTTGEETKYKCDDAIVAFRPLGMDEALLDDITENESAFFSDLSYHGYITSLWKLDLGASLLAVGVSSTGSVTFTKASLNEIGISTLQKEGPEPDYPWRVFYQGGPAETQEELDAITAAIDAELAAIGFVNREVLFIKNHRYGVKPQTEANILNWKNFFDDANDDDDHLYWTGSVAAPADASENVWAYSLNLLDDKFPGKSSKSGKGKGKGSSISSSKKKSSKGSKGSSHVF